MEFRLYDILCKLPEEVRDSLEENRGDESAVKFLLKMCIENNIISADEARFVYRTYASSSPVPEQRQHTAPTGYANQTSQQQYPNYTPYAQQSYPNQMPYAQPAYNNPNSFYEQQRQTNAHAIEAQLINKKKGRKRRIICTVVAVINLLCSLLGLIVVAFTEPPKKANDNLMSINAEIDYFVEEAIIIADYAEHFEYPADVKNPDNISDELKTVKETFYIVLLQDNYSNNYLASFSVKPESDIEESIKNFDFENEIYNFSAYCTARDMSKYKVVFDGSEKLDDIYKESCADIISYIGESVDVVDMNFEYQHPEDYDYVKSEKEGGAFVIGFYLVIAVIFFAAAASGKKKQKEAEEELVSLGYSE